ncbi:MAG: helix-turn-helix transcriptional regulator [Solirubrobacteraceae bacterium]
MGAFEELLAPGIARALVGHGEIELVRMPTASACRRPDVALLDGDRGALSTAESLRTLAPEIGFVILTAGETSLGILTPPVVCLSKGATASQLSIAVRLAAEARPNPSISLDLSKLTTREREVLIHIRAGKTQTDIAQTLTISRNTVGTHVKSLRTKLKIATSRELRKVR